MNFKLVLKTYSQLRQLSDDEAVLLATLRAMSDSERELLVESLGPPVKAKGKVVTKKFSKCDVCGISKRAAHHRDTDHKDYHEFQSSSSKSKRASGMAAAIHDSLQRTRQATTPALCTFEIDGKVCKGSESDGIHDATMSYSGYHPFVSSLPARNAAGQSSTKDDEANSETDLEDVSIAAGG